MKQMFNRTTLILNILALIILTSSCKKFLEVQLPNDQIADATVYTTKSSIVSAVNGMYSSFANQDNIAKWIKATYWLSDEGLFTPIPANEGGDLVSANLQTTNSYFNLWTNYYTPIYRANQLIENLPKVGTDILSDSIRKSYIAASKYIRAANYFLLANSYGDVPLSLSTNTELNQSMPRTPVVQIYDAIVKDLKEAADDLPITVNTTNSRFVHNKYQPLALLARVYLYMGKWAEAEATATSVINSSQYLMVSGVNNVFKRGSREVILSLGETATTVSYLDRTAVGWNTLPSSAGNTSTLNCAVSPKVLGSFEIGDQRSIEANWTITLFTKIFPNKYLHSLTATSAQVTANPQDFVFQRLAELYLIRAEARAQLGNISGINSASSDLNIIRARAGLAATTATAQSSMLAAIEKERICELFFEGHRWYDLKRTGKLNSTLSTLTYKSTNYKTHFDLWPIADKELNANPALKQNPGY